MKSREAPDMDVYGQGKYSHQELNHNSSVMYDVANTIAVTVTGR